MRLRLQIGIARLVNVSSREKPTIGDGGADGSFVPLLLLPRSFVWAPTGPERMSEVGEREGTSEWPELGLLAIKRLLVAAMAGGCVPKQQAGYFETRFSCA